MSKTVISAGRELQFGVEVERPFPLIPGHAPLGQVDLLIVHWSDTSSERATYDALLRRHLGCHFLLASDGTAIQVGDLASVQYATHGVNFRSVGVECTNPYDLAQQSSSRPRPIWELGIRGDKTKHLGFYPEQLAGMVALFGALCDMLSIPRVIPGRGGVPLDDVVPKARLGNFRGVAGHYHIDGYKIDAGMRVWDAFLNGGFGVEDVLAGP